MAREAELIGAPELPALDLDLEKPREEKRRRPLNGRSLLATSFTIILLALFLSPLLRTLSLSLKSAEQITTIGAPIWPADPGTFEYEGDTLDVYLVPLPDGTTKELALFDPGRQESGFIDPADPDGGVITWVGSYRALEQPWEFAPQWGNFGEVWTRINFPRLMFNTIALAVIGGIGTITDIRMRSGPAPSIFAASSSSRGIVRKYWRNRKTSYAFAKKAGTSNGSHVPTQPRLTKIV